MGLELLKTTKHTKSNCIVCTQKQIAFKQFKGSITTEYIRESLGKTTNNKFPVMMFLLDIPDRNLVYVSGDELDPYTTEYDSKMDTRYSFNLQKFKNADILSVESWHFYLGKTRLKCKKILTLC